MDTTAFVMGLWVGMVGTAGAGVLGLSIRRWRRDRLLRRPRPMNPAPGSILVNGRWVSEVALREQETEERLRKIIGEEMTRVFRDIAKDSRV